MLEDQTRGVIDTEKAEIKPQARPAVGGVKPILVLAAIVILIAIIAVVS